VPTPADERHLKNFHRVFCERQVDGADAVQGRADRREQRSTNNGPACGTHRRYGAFNALTTVH
jgi:hypothetical protein